MTLVVGGEATRAGGRRGRDHQAARRHGGGDDRRAPDRGRAHHLYWFGPRQRKALAEAARRAGLETRQIMSEGTAIALSLTGGRARAARSPSPTWAPAA